MNSSALSLPSTRILSSTICGPEGEAAIKMDALAIAAGQRITLTIESTTGPWRQGIFLATQGKLRAAGSLNSSLVIWSDAAPARSEIDVVETHGILIVYNVWDSGRGLRRFESQSATSGMLIERLQDGSSRYSCTDMGTKPDFKKIVFRLRTD